MPALPGRSPAFARLGAALARWARAEARRPDLAKKELAAAGWNREYDYVLDADDPPPFGLLYAIFDDDDE